MALFSLHKRHLFESILSLGCEQGLHWRRKCQVLFALLIGQSLLALTRPLLIREPLHIAGLGPASLRFARCRYALFAARMYACLAVHRWLR